jgi:hypothetical protein
MPIADAAAIARLPHVHRATTRVRGRPLEIFVFDHHRGAFALWALASQARGAPLSLLSFDRHLDLERPAEAPPGAGSPLEVLERYARLSLSPANDDHIVAAMEAGAVGDAALFARSHAPRSAPFPGSFQPYLDASGRRHHCHFAHSPDDAPADLLAWLARAGPIALDVDLDCFTTLSDGHPDEVVSWDAELIDAFLRPPDSERFWDALLERAAVLTIAREPYHCGGLERGARLWLAFCEVFFRRVLGVPAP